MNEFMTYSQPFKCPVSNDMVRAAFDSYDQHLIFVPINDQIEEETKVWVEENQSHAASLDEACRYIQFALRIPVHF